MRSTRCQPSRIHPIANRRGAAAVEFAIVVPVVFTFFFAAFEFCRVAMIRHTADNAVYEGARRGMIPGGSAADVRREAQALLSTVGVDTFSIDVVPGVISRETPEVTVRLTVPLDDNSFLPNQFFGGRDIVRELTLRREGANGEL